VFGKWNDGWIVRTGLEYSVMVPWLMQETLAFKQMMNQSVLSATKLNQPISFESNLVSTKAWKFLEQTVEGEKSHLRNNGFKVLVDEGCSQISKL